MDGRSIGHRRHGWQSLAGAVLLGWLFAAPAQAVPVQMQIMAVGVDNTSSAAEEKAMDYAVKRAVYLTARKMGVQDPGRAVAKLTPESMKLIVRGATMGETKRIGATTYANVQVTIMDEALRQALKVPEVAEPAPEAATPPTRGVLVLPLYVTPARAYLWEKDNVLQAPLAEELLRQAHGAVLIPGGDYEDLRLIDHQNALTVKAEEMKPMFERYGAKEIVIAVVTPGAVATSEPDSVLLRRLSLTQPLRNEVMEIKPEAAEDGAQVRLTRTVKALATAFTQMANSTAEQQQARLDAAQKIKVAFIYTTPRTLAEMQKALRESKGVLQLDMPAIALKDMRGTVYLEGDKTALKETLQKKGIIVTEGNEAWTLSTR